MLPSARDGKSHAVRPLELASGGISTSQATGCSRAWKELSWLNSKCSGSLHVCEVFDACCWLSSSVAKL